MSASLAFRDMTPADVPAVLSIDREAFETPWTAEGFLECLAGGSRCRVAFAGKPDDVAGYCITHQALDEAEVYTIAVRRDYRRQGVGRALLREALEAARLNAARVIFLEVRITNASARALYESEAFQQVGLRRGYYKKADGSREDAVLMARELADAA